MYLPLVAFVLIIRS